MLSLVFYQNCQACFILFLKDENNILVANHEDWFARDGAIKINLPASNRYGSITFTFLTEGWAQGGMNEKGLFFDAAQTPYHEIFFESDKQKPKTYPWQEILDRAETVKEALKILRHYALYELSESTIVLADATGDAAIVGVHNNILDVRPLSGQYMIQTNFNRWHPELSDDSICERYQKAEQNLLPEPDVTVMNMRSILDQTHQDSLTIYSNIYDLQNKTIYTYNKRNFNDAIITKLPDAFKYGECLLSLDSLSKNDSMLENCDNRSKNSITIKGKVSDENGIPLPYANIGLSEKNVGTLSDPDGTFEISLPRTSKNDSLMFSTVGFETKKIALKELEASTSPIDIKLNAAAFLLNEITISDKKLKSKITRLGWMGGKDGILPLDTIMGGGVVALLVEAPQTPFYIEKLQVRLMYNSKDTVKFRFHIYEFDSVNRKPGKELLTNEIILKEEKKFGWLRFNLARENITINKRKVCIGFEWLDDRQYRFAMVNGLRQWEVWKKEQFEIGNKKVEYIPPKTAEETGNYKYHGNMMDWPGFTRLPPFTGLMVETGKRAETQTLLTFERQTSFGQWTEIQSTLNAVITIVY
jgi:hypothetical protein